MGLFKKIAEWKRLHENRQSHCTRDQTPFFDIAAKYLPSDKNATIVDIGTGTGAFPNHLGLSDKYENLYLLDGNKNSIKKLKEKYPKAETWQASDRMPFSDGSVNFLHSGHLVEHLDPGGFYSVLKEIDRVICKNGILVISTPLLWENFYTSLTHVKPYNPEVLLNYLCQDYGYPTKDQISKNFTKVKIVYRYRVFNQEEGAFWSSNHLIIEYLIQILNRFVYRLGFRKYEKNGYTIILKKV